MSLRNPLADLIFATVDPYRRAMPDRVSPLFTVCLTLRLAVDLALDLVRLEVEEDFFEELTFVTPRLEDDPPCEALQLL